MPLTMARASAPQLMHAGALARAATGTAGLLSRHHGIPLAFGKQLRLVSTTRAGAGLVRAPLPHHQQQQQQQRQWAGTGVRRRAMLSTSSSTNTDSSSPPRRQRDDEAGAEQKQKGAQATAGCCGHSHGPSVDKDGGSGSSGGSSLVSRELLSKFTMFASILCAIDCTVFPALLAILQVRSRVISRHDGSIR